MAGTEGYGRVFGGEERKEGVVPCAGQFVRPDLGQTREGNTAFLSRPSARLPSARKSLSLSGCMQ